MSLSIVSSFNGVTDPDAGAYIAAVEQADGNQLLEFGVGKAINDFVVGCKQDRIWDAIKASCILAGARTRIGALVPLVGTAPTSFNFVDGDYNRKTGLKGNASNKSLRTGLLANSLANTSHHYFLNGSDLETATPVSSFNFGGVYNGSSIASLFDLVQAQSANRRETRSGTSGNSAGNSATITTGFTSNGSLTASRISSTNLSLFQNGLVVASATNSNTPSLPGLAFGVFARNDNGTASEHTAARINYFSYGDGLSAAATLLLHNRVTDLINAFAVAIP